MTTIIDNSFEIRLTSIGFQWRYLLDTVIVDETKFTTFQKTTLQSIKTRKGCDKFIENIDKWFTFRLKLDSLD